jgi:hypothetical protein
MPYRLYYKIPDQFIAVDFGDETYFTNCMTKFIQKLKMYELPYALFEQNKRDTWEPHRLSNRDKIIYEAIRNDTKIRCIRLVKKDDDEFIA